MEHTNDLISSVILLGGQSSRFKSPKHLAKLNNRSFLSLIENALYPLPVSYSVAKINNTLPSSSQIVDKYKRIGPIDGIYTSLKLSTTKFTLITSCDLPLLTRELVMEMIGLAICYDKTIIASVNDKLMPTFAVYKSTDYKQFEAAINEKNYRLMSVLNDIDYHQHKLLGQKQLQLTNINTQEQLQKISKPFIFCVCGYKDSGKTTLVSALISKYKADGYKVATLKHDGHDFEIDSSTDSGKFISLNSDVTTIYSNTKYQTTILEQFKINDWITSVSDYDVIIIEGMKNSTYPKIVIEGDIQLLATNRIMTVNKQTRDDITGIYQTLKEVANERFK